MDAIKWIEKDLSRPEHTSLFWRRFFLFFIFLLPVFLGLGLRTSMEGTFLLRTLIPNLVAAILLSATFSVSYGKNFSHRQSFGAGLTLLLGSGLLAIERAIFPVGQRTTYVSSEIFWHENLMCFTKGGFTSLIVGIFLVAVVFMTSALPSRRWRALLSVLVGLSGTIMLGFHCDSSSPGHIFFAHLGQAILTGLLVFVTQEFLFRLRVKRAFPDLMKKINNQNRLG